MSVFGLQDRPRGSASPATDWDGLLCEVDAPKVGRSILRNVAIVALLAVGLVCPTSGQEQTGSVRVEVHTGPDLVAGAEVVVSGTTQLTDELGIVVVIVPVGDVLGAGRWPSYQWRLCGLPPFKPVQIQR